MAQRSNEWANITSPHPVLVEDVRDYSDYRRSFVDQASPEAAELGRAWHDHKLRVRESGNPIRRSHHAGESGK